MRPFYGKEIDPGSEQEFIEKILAKYRNQLASEELKKSIHSELTAAKEKGDISIPFKVVMRKDTSGKHHDYIEVILDTKV